MKTGKQVLCFLLALALILGLLPAAVQPVRAAGGAQSAENPVVSFNFSIDGAGTIVVDGEDKGTSVEVESGNDLTFSVKAPGYQIHVVLLGGNRPIAPNSDGTYTISNVSTDVSVTIMVTQKDNQRLSFAVSGATVTVGGEDYTNADYSARYNEKVTFTVVPEVTGSEVTVVADNCTVADHGDGTYTTSGITAATRITIAASGQEAKIFCKLQFSFSVPGVAASVFVNDMDMGTSFDVEQGSDVTFRIVVSGYKVAVLLRGGRPFPANEDGSYTISNVFYDQSFTVMLTEVVAGKAEVTFHCTNAKVTVDDVDYTGGTYSHPGGGLKFTVEVPEGYYVKSVTATPDQDIFCGSEMQNQKLWYAVDIESDNEGKVAIDIVAAEGTEDTWPLEYQYSMNGPSRTYATVKACDPTYEGALEIPETVIHNGVPFPVQGIGEYAFIECYTLTELTMPDTVVWIEYMALSYTGLRHIRLSENLQSMDEDCFVKCIYLEELTLPESLKAIPKNAFDSCYSLRTVVLPDGLQSIGEHAFWDCYDLSEITIPAGVTEIAGGTFMGCKSLAKVTFLGPVTSIGETAFYNTRSLKHIDLPGSLTSLGSGAFYQWYSDGETDRSGGLEEIVLPAGLTKIEEDTFRGCYALRSVHFLGKVTSIGDGAFCYTSSLLEIDLPESVCSIGKKAFFGSGLQKILLPKDCVDVEQDAFTSSALEAFEVDPGNTAFQAGDDGVLYSRDGKQLVLYPYSRQEAGYTVRPGTVEIGAYAFYGVRNLEHIILPDSLREIGDYAFAEQTKLKEVALPEGLEDISSNYTFYHCSSLTELSIPSTLRDISGSYVFSRIGITELVLPDGLQNISGDNIFYSCKRLNKVLLPCGIKEISGDNIFSYCNALSSLELPKDLELIRGSWNFAYTSIEKLALPNTLQEIQGADNFYACEKLSEVVLPDGLRILGDGSFGSCTSLKRIQLPASLTRLNSGTFSGCSELKHIEIPEKVTSIGNRCFAGCENLKELELPMALQAIGDYCFEGCNGLEAIKLPLGLQSIGSYVFACTGITELSVPQTVTSWGDCPIGVTKGDRGYVLDTNQTYVIYFAGNLPEWEGINGLPNMTNLYCYFPRDNTTWTENLRYLMDGPAFFRIHWLSADVSLPESLELTVGCKQRLTEVVRPADDSNLLLTWSSSDETVVRVDEAGMLTGVAPGTAIITASAGGGAYSAQCQVTVLEDSAPHYEDVPEDAWYYEAVQYTSEHGLFQGITETKFGPHITMTRGMLVTVLYRLEGEPAVDGETQPFTDVDASQYYGDAITWAANSGVVNGMTDTRFAPEAAVTREQMVAILYRYAGLKGADVTVKADLESFPDHDQVKPYARDAFSWAVGAGIIQGDSNGGITTLSPCNSATRAQVAAVLMRYLERLG